MQHEPSREPEELEAHLLGLIEAAREQAREDPFRNPVLAVTLAITRRFDRDEISTGDLDGLFARLRAAALAARAERLRAYVGLDAGPDDPQAGIPARLVAAAMLGTLKANAMTGRSLVTHIASAGATVPRVELVDAAELR